MNLHRMRMLRSSVRVLVAVAAVAGPLFAEYGRFSIAEEPAGPRSSAMGSAGTALAGGGFGCYNPASPAFAAAPFLTTEYGKVPGDQSRSLFETSWMFSRWFAGASLRFHSTDWQEADETAVGAMSSNQILQATITGGFTWGNFASGHGFSFFHERIGDQPFRAFTYSPGFVYRLVPNRVTLGASMLHYLRLDTLGSPKYKTPLAWRYGAIGLPRYVRVGAAWSDTLRQAGLPFTIAGDLIYSDVYDRVMAPIGAEVWILPYLAARAGTRINHPSDKAHFGVGLRWGTVVFDFDYGITQLVKGADPEPKWLVGLTYSIPGGASKKTVTREPAKQRNIERRNEPVAPEAVAPIEEPVKAATDSLVTPVPEIPPDSPRDSLRQHLIPDTTAVEFSGKGSLRPDSTGSAPIQTPVPDNDSTVVEPRIPSSVPNQLDSMPAMSPPVE